MVDKSAYTEPKLVRPESARDDSGNLFRPAPYLSRAPLEIEKLIRSNPSAFLQLGASDCELLALLIPDERQEFIVLCEEHRTSLSKIAAEEWPLEGMARRLSDLFGAVSERCTDLWLDAVSAQGKQAALLREGFQSQAKGCAVMTPISSKLLVTITAADVTHLLRAYGENHVHGWLGPNCALLRKITSLDCEKVWCAAVNEALLADTDQGSLRAIPRCWDQIEQIASQETVHVLADLITQHAPHLWFNLPTRLLPRHSQHIHAALVAVAAERRHAHEAIYCVAEGIKAAVFTDLTAQTLRGALCDIIRTVPNCLVNFQNECASVLGEKEYLAYVQMVLKHGGVDEFVISVASQFANMSRESQSVQSALARAFLETPRLVVHKIENGSSPDKIPGFKAAHDVAADVLNFSSPIDIMALLVNSPFLNEALRHDDLREKLFHRCLSSGEPASATALINAIIAQDETTGLPEGCDRASLGEEIASAIVGLLPLTSRVKTDDDVRAHLFQMGASLPVTAEDGLFQEHPTTWTKPAVTPQGWSRTKFVSFAAGRDFYPEATSKDVAQEVFQKASPFEWSKGTATLSRLVHGDSLSEGDLTLIAHHPVAHVVLPGSLRNHLAGAQVDEWAKLSNVLKRAIVACCIFDDLPANIQEEIRVAPPAEARHVLELLEFAVGNGLDSIEAPTLSILRDRGREHVVTLLTHPALDPQQTRNVFLRRFSDHELVCWAELRMHLARHSPEWMTYFNRAVIRSSNEVKVPREHWQAAGLRESFETSVTFVPNTFTRNLLASDFLQHLHLLKLSSIPELKEMSAAVGSQEQQLSAIPSAKLLWSAILAGKLDTDTGSLYFSECAIPVNEACEIISQSSLGRNMHVRDGIEYLAALYAGQPVSVPISVSVLDSPREIFELETEHWDTPPRGTTAYPAFARTKAVLAAGDAAKLAAVRTKSGTLLRVDLLFSFEDELGRRGIFIDPLANASMDDALAVPVLQWAQALSSSSAGGVIVSESFIDHLSDQAIPKKALRCIGSIDTNRLSIADGEVARDFYIASSFLTNLAGRYV